jgi:gliding motility-associated-like protein
MNNTSLMEPTTKPPFATTYTLTATVPGLLCTTTDNVNIVIYPEVVVEADSAKSVCINQSIELNVLPKADKYSYSWSGPDGFTSMLQTPFIRRAIPSSEGIYSVTVTDKTTNCYGKATTFVKVGNDSLALTDVTPSQTIRWGSSIQLNASSAVLYTWAPNDGSLNNPNINNPIATPTERTRYAVYAVGSNGCIDTASVTIDIEFADDIFIPTAFTPNGDGLNDLFRASGRSHFKLVEMSIFNRWGELVYHVEDGSDAGWDGTYKGMKSDMGTYNYILILSKPGKDVESVKGNVTLVR